MLLWTIAVELDKQRCNSSHLRHIHEYSGLGCKPVAPGGDGRATGGCGRQEDVQDGVVNEAASPACTI